MISTQIAAAGSQAPHRSHLRHPQAKPRFSPSAGDTWAPGPQGLKSENPSPFQKGVLPVKNDIGPVPARPPQVPVRLTLGKPTATVIKPGFAGLSQEITYLCWWPKYFNPNNRQLINLFRAMGITRLRIGGATADYSHSSPTRQEIDNLFKFAQKVPGLKVVYTLRMLHGNPQADASTASYIWKRYPHQIQSFCIGNEPDAWRSFHDPSVPKSEKLASAPDKAYMNRWLAIAKAVDKATGGAPLSGPDAYGSFNIDFVRQAAKAGIRLASVNTHQYVNGMPKKSAAAEVHAMLSSRNDKIVSNYLSKTAQPLERLGQTVLMTEDDDEGLGNHGASDSMASVVWAMNNMFQLAQGGVSGTYYHNLRVPTRTVYETPDGHFAANPKGLAIAAFNHFVHGKVTPVTISDPGGTDLRAYAVTQPGGKVLVALMNESYGPSGKTAKVALPAACGARVTRIEAPHDNVEANTGITLGGATLRSSSPSLGDVKWQSVAPGPHGSVDVEVPPASVAFVVVSRSGRS